MRQHGGGKGWHAAGPREETRYPLAGGGLTHAYLKRQSMRGYQNGELENESLTPIEWIIA